MAALLGSISYLEWLEIAMLSLVPPVHLYKHLKYAYGLGRTEAAARLILLLCSIIIVISTYFLMLILLGLF